jgi:hypothetical protein
MPRPLTIEDRTAVNLALKSESYSHRYWPYEVLEAFVNADVELTTGSRALPEPSVYQRLLSIASSYSPARIGTIYSRIF